MTVENIITFGHSSEPMLLSETGVCRVLSNWVGWAWKCPPHVSVHWGSCIFSYWYFETWTETQWVQSTTKIWRENRSGDNLFLHSSSTITWCVFAHCESCSGREPSGTTRRLYSVFPPFSPQCMLLEGRKKDQQDIRNVPFYFAKTHALYHMMLAFRDQLGVVKGDRIHPFCLFFKTSWHSLTPTYTIKMPL